MPRKPEYIITDADRVAAGAKLREYRRKWKLSQWVFMERWQVRQQQLSALELGRRGVASRIVKIALDINPDAREPGRTPRGETPWNPLSSPEVNIAAGAYRALWDESRSQEWNLMHGCIRDEPATVSDGTAAEVGAMPDPDAIECPK